MKKINKTLRPQSFKKIVLKGAAATAAAAIGPWYIQNAAAP